MGEGARVFFLIFVRSVFHNSTNLLCGAIEVFVIEDSELILLTCDHALGNVGVGSLEAQDHRFVEAILLVACNDGLGELVASEDSTEDVHEDGFHFGVVVKELEGLGELVTLGAAADVQEVSWFSTILLNNIHGGHGESGAVDKAADISSDVDVVEVVLLGVCFFGVVLGLVFLGEEVFLTESSV